MAGSPIELPVMREETAQISFADLEFMFQGVVLEPLLQTISDFIN